MKAEERAKNDALVSAASVNLTKNLVGAGIFSLPMALLRGSVVSGVVIMLMVGTVQAMSFVLLAYLCQHFGARCYREAFSAAFGKRAGSVVDALIAVNGFMTCMAYNILVADFLEKGLEGLLGMEDVSRSLVIWVNTLCITLPLSHARNLAALRYTSMLGLAIIAFVFMYVLMDFMNKLEEAKPILNDHWFRLDLGLFSTFAICTTAFQAHYNSPRIFKELNSSLELHVRCVANSFGASFLIYASFAVAGLGLFGDGLSGNILKNYPAEGNVAVLASWLGMAFSVTFTYPLIFTTGRDALIGFVPVLRQASVARPAASHVAITSGLVCLISSVACVVDDVSVVVGLLGSTLGSCLCWIFPAIIYLKVAWASPVQDNERPLLRPGQPAPPKIATAGGVMPAFAVMMVAVGLVSMVVGIIQVLQG